MSKNIKHFKKSEKELTFTALEKAAKRMDGEHPALSFIEKLLTESEKLTIGRRILIAQMILAGKSQAEIRTALSVSANTFTRTRKWLEGQIPNYNDALEEAKAIEEQGSTKRDRQNRKGIRAQYADKATFAGLKQRYPMHFLLFNLADELLSLKNKK